MLSLGGVLGMVVAGAVAGAATFGVMLLREKVVVAGAVLGESARQVGICQGQLAAQLALLDANVSAGIGAAGQAADAVQTTPIERAQIIALCKADGPQVCSSYGRVP